MACESFPRHSCDSAGGKLGGANGSNQNAGSGSYGSANEQAVIRERANSNFLGKGRQMKRSNRIQTKVSRCCLQRPILGVTAILLSICGQLAAQMLQDNARSAVPNSQRSTIPSGSFVPKMGSMSTNAKRDASPPADAAAKAQIKSKLGAQVTSARQLTGPFVKMTSPTPSEAPEIRTLQQQKAYVASLRTQAGSTGQIMTPIQVSKTIGSNQPSNPMLHAPLPNQICPVPQVRAVNGKTSGVVFTQDPLYNDYIITGCGFGTQPGQVYLSGAVTGGRLNMLVKPQQWTDTRIEAVVEPGLTGVLDGWPDLIVASPGTPTPVKFSNSRFYAQRQRVLLPTIPQQHATLANVTVGDNTHGYGTMYCAGPDTTHLFPCVAFNAGPPLDGITNGHDHHGDPSQAISNAVDRDGGQLEFKAGEDVYDLSSMAPGFEIDDVNVFWYAWTQDVCEGWASDAYPKKVGDSVGYETNGYYRFYKRTNTKLVVDWGVDHCAWRWLGVFKVNDWYNSGYSLQVYVKGPIGVDPWTGHAINKGVGLGEREPARVIKTP
jgi:hypothetical protein